MAEVGEYVIQVSNEGTSKVPSKPSKDEKALSIDKNSSLEMSPLVGSSSMPPTAPGPDNIQRKYSKSVYLKSKSRLIESSRSLDYSSDEEDNRLTAIGSRYNQSSTNVDGSTTPLVPPGKEVKNDEEEDIFTKDTISRDYFGQITTLALFESAFFVLVLSALVVSLTVDVVKNRDLWGLKVWKWCVLVAVIFSGMLATHWFIHLIVILIEAGYLLKKKVLYFVHGLKRSVQVFIWLGLILITWLLLFDEDVHQSRTTTRVLNIITRTLVSLVTGSFLWMVKTLLLKILAAKFNVNNFFEKIQESVFHQYVLQTLLGPPLIENAKKEGRVGTTGRLSLTSVGKKGTVVEKKIDMGKVHEMKRETVTAWRMRVLVEAVRSPNFTTISEKLDKTASNAGKEEDDTTTEKRAKDAARRALVNVSRRNRNDHITEGDLLRFMIKEEVDLVLSLFVRNENGDITKDVFTEWVVEVYKNRKALAHTLNDSKTAVEELNRLVSGILIVITAVIWLLLLEIATTKVLLFLSTQIIALAFVIGSTCKNLFESIIFVFVMHPYDVGDRCVIDGDILLVEEMNLLTTVFLRINNEKVYYSNVVLSTKRIGNYRRSPEMGECVDFSIAFSTSASKISELNDKITLYLKEKSEYWSPLYMLAVKEMENMNKLKMALFTTHTISYQDIRERFVRKNELTYALREMLMDLGIDYTLLPQQVVLTKSGEH